MNWWHCSKAATFSLKRVGKKNPPRISEGDFS